MNNLQIHFWEYQTVFFNNIYEKASFLSAILVQCVIFVSSSFVCFENDVEFRSVPVKYFF